MQSQAEPMLPVPFQVQSRRRETVDTYTLALTPQEASPGGFAFAPGQFNMLYVFGKGEVPISISGDPARPETLGHTVRAVGKVSGALCKLNPGEQLGVRGPFGTNWPVAEAKDHDLVIVAGGLGLAPLRPAIYHALAHRDDYGKMELIYGARTPADLLYRRELERWRGRFDVRVHVSVDSAGPGWRGNVGVVTTVIPRTRFDPDNTVALVCGPGIMIRFTVQELLGRGLPPDKIYISGERNMKCGLGLCGHCQVGPYFVCKDGPVFSWEVIREWLERREI